MTRACLLCEGTTEDEPGIVWTPVVLLEDVELKTTLFGGAFDAMTFMAGLWWLCGPCAAWWPEARTAAPPDSISALLDALTALIQTSELRRQLHREVLGGYRHIARQLRPVGDG